MAACPLVSSGLLVGFCAIVTIEVARGATSRAGPAGRWIEPSSDVGVDRLGHRVCCSTAASS
eukprot:4052794-Prymnesium_polylepis.1